MVFHHCRTLGYSSCRQGSACLPLALVHGRHSLANAFGMRERNYRGYSGALLMPMMVSMWLPQETVSPFPQEMRKLETWQEPLKGNRFS